MNKLRYVFIFIVLAAIFSLPLAKNAKYWGIQDWDHHTAHLAQASEVVVKYHQFPLWNPYHCGGMPALANPQSRILSPALIFSIIFGSIIGVKLEIFFYLIFGLVGLFALARYYSLTPLAAFFASLIYMLSGMFSLSLTVGMVPFLSIGFIPWIFLFFKKAIDQKSGLYVVVTGFFLALLFFNGVHLVILIIPLLILQVINEFLGTRKLTALILLVAVLLTFFGLSAVKLLPSLELMSRYPRMIREYSGYSLKGLALAFLSKNQSLEDIEKWQPGKRGFWEGITYGMDENGMYLGIIPLVLFILGLWLNAKKRWQLTVIFLIFLWLSFGERIPISLWQGLKPIFPFNYFRVAQRFRFIFMMPLSIFTGLGLEALINGTKKLARKFSLLAYIPLLIIIIVIYDLIKVNSLPFKEAFPIPPMETSRRQEFTQTCNLDFYDKYGFISGRTNPPLRSAWSSEYPMFLSNQGVVEGCYEAIPVSQNAVCIDKGNYKGEIFLENTTGEVKLKYWSPNEMIIKTSVLAKGLLVINQNYDPGWKIKKPTGRRVKSLEGLLSTDVFPEDEEVVFYYSPLSFIIGSTMSLASLLVVVIYIYLRLTI